MAQNLTTQDIKLLDQTRQRLSQLTNALASLQQSLLTSNPLPPYSSLHSQTLILGQTLTSLAAHLQSRSSSSSSTINNSSNNNHTSSLSSSMLGISQLSAIAAYPLPAYPGREEEGLLSQLLRKKLEVGVEEWVQDGRETGEQVLLGPEKGIGAGEEAEAWRSLWEWAGVEANGVAREYDWGGDLDDESEEENADGNEEGKADEKDGGGANGVNLGEEGLMGGAGDGGGGKPVPLDDILRFMARGEPMKS